MGKAMKATDNAHRLTHRHTPKKTSACKTTRTRYKCYRGGFSNLAMSGIGYPTSPPDVGPDVEQHRAMSPPTFQKSGPT